MSKKMFYLYSKQGHTYHTRGKNGVMVFPVASDSTTGQGASKKYDAFAKRHTTTLRNIENIYMNKYLLITTIAIMIACDASAQRDISVKDAGSLLPLDHAQITLNDGTVLFTNHEGVCRLPKNKKVTRVWADKHWEKCQGAHTLTGEVVLQPTKQRVVVTTDLGGSDPDDRQSLVHLLACASEIDIEGIVSNMAWTHDPLHTEEIHKIIDGYDKVSSCLRMHDNAFPSAAYLHAVTKAGQSLNGMKGVGMNKDSEGSEHIIAVVDRHDDARPVWLTAWGGMGTIAQALWKVSQTRTAAEAQRFMNKIRIYDILGQDDCGAWIAKTFPDVLYIRAKQVYGWGADDAWLETNVMSQGTFGTMYPKRKWATEGDSPSFMYLLSNGLNAPEHIDWGGWGNRFSTEKTEGIRGMSFVKSEGLQEEAYDPYFMHTETSEGIKATRLWNDHLINDFAARMQWSTSPRYLACNHHPVAAINGDVTRQYLEMDMENGTSLTLDGAATTDPDGNALSYQWMYYREPGTAGEGVTLRADGARCEVTASKDTKGKTAHILFIVTDNGRPALTSYRRVVLHIR